MKYFLIGIASASALFLIPSSNAMSQQNRAMKSGDFNKVVNEKLTTLKQKKACLEGSKNFGEYKSCQGIEFDKFVEKKIKRVDKLAKCVENVSNFKELKKCKKVMRRNT